MSDQCGKQRLRCSKLLRAGLLASVWVWPYQAAAQEQLVDEMVVTGRAQAFYRVDETTVGTKTPTDILSIPQAVKIIPLQLIEDQAARDITDLYRNVAGLTTFSYSGVTFRGFRQDQLYYNGVRGDPFVGFGIPLLFNVERLEFLKGPSSTLFGQNQPGGIINYVTKKPEAEERTQVTATMGNLGLYGGSGAVTGPLTSDGSVLYRFGAGFERQDGFRNNYDESNLSLAAALTFDLGEDTALTVEAEHINQEIDGARLRGVPTDDDGNFLTDISFNTNEATDFQNLDAVVLQARLDHAFSDDLMGDVTVRWLDNEATQNYHEPRGLIDSDGDGVAETMRREFRDQVRENSEWSVTGNLIYETAFAGVEHTLLLGGDYARAKADFTYYRATFQPGGTVPPIDLFNPVYGQSGRPTYLAQLSAPFRVTEDTFQQWGLYLQDQVTLSEQWEVLLGARFDGFEEENTVPGGVAASDEDLSLRAGVTYKPTDTVSLYASYSEAFVPQSASNQDAATGGPFDPERSHQWEAGAKAKLFDDRVLATVAAYQIVKENVLQSDPDPAALPGALVALGEVTSEGFEVELVGDITPSWTFTANYAFNEARITGDAGTSSIRNAVGDEFANAPDHQFGLWTRYDIAPLNSAIAGGVEYVSERLSLSGQTVKPYAIYDLSWQTSWDNLLFQLNVRNLFDKTYAASGFIERTGHFPGEPRTVTFSVTASL